MDTHKDSSSEIYEVEKIINCKYYRNKKYYLVKWLCYPIYESTWEPKSSLKNLNYMINAFEAEYPYSVDQYMYEIYSKERVQHFVKIPFEKEKNGILFKI